MRVVLAVGVALLLASPALADGRMSAEENPAQTAQALSLQALAILDWGLSHEEALEKLDAALQADDKGGVDLRALRAAHEALEQEEVERAHELLHGVFPSGVSHLAGVTYRPAVGAGEVIVLGVGVVTIALAAVGLVRRRRTERALA